MNIHRLLILASLLAALPVAAQVPGIINYQGRVAVGTVNFDGSGQFKFALVNSNGSTTYWSNDGSSTAGSEPSAAVALTVTKGLYSVLLGDTALTNMTAVPASVFNNTDVRLRVWFNDGTNGFQLLTPDQRIAAVGYAIMAGSVPDGSITSAKIASGAIGSSQLAIGLSLNGTLTGNASTATTASTAGSFSGSLLGDVTSGQGATVVSAVGGSTAANVHASELLANAATNANTASAIVKRDASGNFSTGTITAAGGFALPTTSSTSVGVINQNGTRFIHSYGSGNFFAGAFAGNFVMTGNSNTGIGSQALSSNSTGFSNTASGQGSLLSNTTGTNNTAIGNGSLYWNTTGTSNTASGSAALRANTTGTFNTADGASALIVNTTGISNTAIGGNALQANTIGSFNTANGGSALNFSVSAARNVAVGYHALFTQSFDNGGVAWNSNNVAVGYVALNSNQPISISTGINNTALGTNALQANTIGSSNIAVGNNAGNLLTTGDNNIDIGNVGVAGESSKIRIGTAGTQTATFVAGITGVGISGGAAMYVGSSGQLGILASSRRFKDNIQTMDKASESLLLLRPVTFRYKLEIDAKSIPQWGLIAEEVNAVNPDLVVRDDQGVIQTVRYEQVNAMLLNEFLKDHRRADAKDVEIAELKNRLADLEAKDKEREARLAKLEQFIADAPQPAAAKVTLTADAPPTK